MKPGDEIQLIGALLDLPILDADCRYSGIVDDIELEPGPAGPRVTALLVGPGAWRARLPRWIYRLFTAIAGERVTRVPWEAVIEIGSAVVLDRGGEAFGLHRGEARAARLLPHAGAHK